MHRELGIKALLLVGLGVLIALVLHGCFIAPSPITEATLRFSDLVGPVGAQGEIKVSVANMPGGGLSALVVGSESSPGAEDWLGLEYDPTQFQVTEVQGLNNFQVLAWGTHDTDPTIPVGEVRFVAVCPDEGIVDGDVALIIGNRLGGTNFNFQVRKANLQLLDASGNLIPAAAYNIATGQAPPYYTRGDEGR